MWKSWGYRNKNATIAPAFSVEPLLSKDEVDSQYQAGKTCKMVPLQRVALDKKNGEEGKDNQGDNLLNYFKLPECEWSAKLLAAEAVGWHLKAVLEQGNTPTDEHDGNNAKALKLRLEGDVTIPGKCHKDI
jgi:hypothetical protein